VPQIIIYAKATIDQAMDGVATACKKEDFVIDSEKDTSMTVRKGSAAAAFFLGWLVKYVVATIKVSEAEDGEVKIAIDWSNAWFRWFMAMMQNPGIMKTFANAVESGVEKAGGEVTERKNK
jgi:hypothetical protein